MKLGIIGTRGIPNRYGGFEQFTEFIAPALVARGHRVTVYNSSLHPYQDSYWQGVRVINKKDPEDILGAFGQFVYDFNCILDTRGRDFDIILQLGYTSSSIWSFLFPRRAIVVTNMDGLEWKRSKYSRPVRHFLKYAEKWAANYSNRLIADSKGIQQYLADTYDKPSRYIAYGASVFTEPDEKILSTYGLTPFGYNLLIARMEPENNLETILQGHYLAGAEKPLILIGNHQHDYGRYLKQTYESSKAVFLGPLYDLNALNNLRYFSHLYFHGHSAGGTNPSLLEAMASSALIAAHDNVFNKTVLGEDAFYFAKPTDIVSLIAQLKEKDNFKSCLENNLQKIKQCYTWNYITDQLEQYFLEILNEAGR